MPVVEKRNIALGNGNIEFGEYVNDVFTSYTDVGAVKGDAEIMHEREVLDFETGRPLLVILQEVIRERVTFRATLAEVALATIKMALGQGNITTTSIPVFLDGTSNALRGTLQTGVTAVESGTTFNFGGSPTHAYIGLRFTHKRNRGNRLIWEAYKASPTGSLSLPFRETDWNIFGVEFRLLADTTKAEGYQYYQLHIENPPA